MKRIFAMVAITGVIGFWAPGGPVLAETCTFTPSSGNWDVSGNWDCAHVPTENDRVIIPSGKTCTVNISNAAADTLTVASTGTLNIESNASTRKLTLDDEDISNNTTIDGSVNLQGSNSVLAFQDNNQTIAGSGNIVGGNNAAQIAIADNKTLTNDTNIGGKLDIAGGTGSTFVNSGTVHANVAGTLAITCNLIDDDSTATWAVSSGTSTILQIAVDDTNIIYLDGDWAIDDGAKLVVDSIGFYTTGGLTWGGGIIDVAGGCVGYWGYTP